MPLPWLRGHGLSVHSCPASSIVVHWHETPQEGDPLGRFAMRTRDVCWNASSEIVDFIADPVRKPLIYPSELRGHGAGGLGDCSELRKAPLAPWEAPVLAAAAVPATVAAHLAAAGASLRSTQSPHELLSPIEPSQASRTRIESMLFTRTKAKMVSGRYPSPQHQIL